MYDGLFTLMNISRPGMILGVEIGANFNNVLWDCTFKCPKEDFKYLKDTIDLGLWYAKNIIFELLGYPVADFAGCLIERKGTNGTCYFLGNCLVTWSKTKQNSIILATSKVEYVAVGSYCAELLGMKQTLHDYGLKLKNIPIFFIIQVISTYLKTQPNTHGQNTLILDII